VTQPLGLFSAFGVELEYMIVDARTLDVRPIADDLLRSVSATGLPECEVERDSGASWSNELVAHVLELKTTQPVSDLSRAAATLSASARELNALLKPLGCRLMPGAMHPWMNPASQTRLWPHDYADVYATFDRLFDCKRHGWANLQSVHLNLPFDGDEEFGRLHAAVRLVLPLLPALCASSPVMDARVTGLMDSRLNVYASNQAHTPSLTGRVIPEPAYTQADYQRAILDPIAADVRRLDPSGVMQPQWMNSRGAIARFDRGSIEIRVMDVQECPAADLAICSAVAQVLEWLVAEGPSSKADQMACPTQALRTVFDDTVARADQAVVTDAAYLDLLAVDHHDKGVPAWEVWSEILELAEVDLDRPIHEPLRTILDDGPLSRRLLSHLGPSPSHDDLARVYARLCDCLNTGTLFRAA
jgi:gamma-glutamyl:cysteine ligase YbdK (ATP-grasp superfamily)